MTIDTHPVLTRAETEAFNRDGYVVLEHVLDSERRAQLGASLDRLLTLAKEQPQHPDFQQEKGTEAGSIRKINNFVRYGQEWWSLVEHPRVLAAVRDLLDDEVRLHHTKLMMKPPFEGSAKEWHQDLASYVDAEEKQRLLALGPALRAADAPLIAAQFYLDDSTETNGCLEFVPGSHTWGLVDPQQADDRAAAARVVKVPAKAGSAALFHCLCLHYSSPNRSPQPRRGPIAQYYAPPTAIHLKDSVAEGSGRRLL